jgi:acetoin utilization protein AcuB
MLVESVMTRSVVTVEPTCSVDSAARLMHQGRFRHLPVVRDGRLIGILSDRDVAAHTDGTVGEVMHTHVISVSPETPVEVAARLLSDNKIGALPVLDPSTDRLVGIVSQTDLVAILARLLGGDGPSTRLELQLVDLPAQLALVASLAQHHHLHITSLVMLPQAEDQLGPRTVVLRVGTMFTRPFVDDLRQAGIAVDAPEYGDA